MAKINGRGGRAKKGKRQSGLMRAKEAIEKNVFEPSSYGKDLFDVMSETAEFITIVKPGKNSQTGTRRHRRINKKK